MHGKPMWCKKEYLLQEAGEVALEYNVHYGWVNNYGLVVMVIGAPWYLPESSLNYIEPVNLPTHINLP